MVGGLTAPFELENAVQEVFVRAFEPKARLAYDGLRPYDDYLVGIARYVALDARRRRGAGREEARSDEELEAAVHSSRPLDEAPDEQAISGEARSVVQAFLSEQGDERDRRLYALRFAEELPQEEVATRAGLTRIQVRRWERKFRERLLRHLKRVGYVG
jgi:RNA polymerase sigma-70 factor (ECF subfamily)